MSAELLSILVLAVLFVVGTTRSVNMGALAFAAASSKTDQLRIAELVETHGRERFAAEWLRHRGLAWAVDLLPEPQPDPLAGRREDASQLHLALKDTTP